MVESAAPKENARSAEYFVEHITHTWHQAVEDIIETGRLLIAAKEELEHGEWGEMFHEFATDAGKLPFGERTAQRLMAIAKHPFLINPTHVSLLPPSWGTLAALAELPVEVLEEMVKDNILNCEVTRKEVEEVRRKTVALGHYRWVNLRDALQQLIKFSQRWPKVENMLKVMQEEIARSELGYELEDEWLEEWLQHSKLEGLSKWVATLEAQYLVQRKQAEAQEAEQEAQKAEQEVQERVAKKETQKRLREQWSKAHSPQRRKFVKRKKRE